MPRCIECSEEKGRKVLLCEDCLEKEHEGHYAESTERVRNKDMNKDTYF